MSLLAIEVYTGKTLALVSGTSFQQVGMKLDELHADGWNLVEDVQSFVLGGERNAFALFTATLTRHSPISTWE